MRLKERSLQKELISIENKKSYLPTTPPLLQKLFSECLLAAASDFNTICTKHRRAWELPLNIL